jgi:hypothetical protein
MIGVQVPIDRRYELDGVVADYPDQAELLGGCPMRPSRLSALIAAPG